MTVLTAGTFRTSDYRRAIPDRIKIIAVLNAILAKLDPSEYSADYELEKLIRFIEALKQAAQVGRLDIDHRPSLNRRDYDTVLDDFIPGQHDLEHLEALIGDNHDERTFGRKAGADRTVTTRNSDVGEAARTRHISDSEKIHQANLATKRGDPAAARRLLGNVRQKTRLRPKRKIQSRGFDKRHRPMRSHGSRHG